MNTRCQSSFFSDFHWAFLWVLAAVVMDDDSVRVPHKGTDKPKRQPIKTMQLLYQSRFEYTCIALILLQNPYWGNCSQSIQK